MATRRAAESAPFVRGWLGNMRTGLLPILGLSFTFGCTEQTVELPTASAGCEAQSSALAIRFAECFGGSPEDFASGFLSPDCDQIQANIVDGTQTYDQAATEACVAAIATMSCTLEPRENMALAVCALSFPGTLALGSACEAQQCAPGGFCEIPDFTCSGTCAPLRSAGQSCLWEECAEGLACVNFSCGTRVGSGEACASANECLGGLSCSADRTCVPRFSAGSLCGSSADCAVGLECRGDTGARTCQEPKIGGDACNPGEQACAIGHCTDEGVCAFGPTIGEACFVGIEPVDCRVGYCDGVPGQPGTCTAEKAVGSPCDRALECESFACAQNVCVAGPCD